METGITELKDKIQNVIDTTDWDQFKSVKTLEKTIETQALLINAVKKCNKVITLIMEDTIKDKDQEE